jgi:hypothetical protein
MYYGGPAFFKTTLEIGSGAYLSYDFGIYNYNYNASVVVG